MSESKPKTLRASRRGFLQCAVGSGASVLLPACSQSTVLEPHFAKVPACDSACLQVDVHCHVFNGSDLPIEGFVTHIAPLPSSVTEEPARALHSAVNDVAPSGKEELAWIEQQGAAIQSTGLRKLSAALPPNLQSKAEFLKAGLIARLGGRTRDAEARLEGVIQLVSSRRFDVACRLVAAYPTVNLFTPLLVDYDFFSEGSPETPLSDQLNVHARISVLSMLGRLGRADARIHPFAPYNPLRDVMFSSDTQDDGKPFKALGERALGVSYDCNAALSEANPRSGLGLLRRAIEQDGFIGAKVYPPIGFLPLGNSERGKDLMVLSARGAEIDAALRDFYAYCEAEDVPITTHGSNSNGYHTGYGILAEPQGWAAVLKEFPNLRLNIGHFGGDQGLDRAGDAATVFHSCRNWLRQVVVLMSTYPNVYADIGCSVLASESGYKELFLDQLKEAFKAFPDLRLRLMYGSDWWINLIDPNSEYFLDAFYDASQSEPLLGTWADFVGNNALRFLGLSRETPTRNRERLIAFYTKHQAALPAWLA